MQPRAFVSRLLIGGLIALTLGACQRTTSQASTGRVPLPPATPHQDLGADTPPVSWLSGTIGGVTAGTIEIRQDDGALVSLQRLAQGGTKLFRVSSGSSWAELAPEAGVRAGEATCIETLLDGSNLVALRVFLGAGCGPV